VWESIMGAGIREYVSSNRMTSEEARRGRLEDPMIPIHQSMGLAEPCKVC
jgi:hypothetical protein